MTKGREKSDGLVVPQGRRKSVPIARKVRGGKGTTASEEVGQLRLFDGTADSPDGGAEGRGAGQPAPRARALPKPSTTKRRSPPAMTMEEIADEYNLITAFQKVASNRGAPGPDRQQIDEVQEHLDEIAPALRTALLEGSYRPGMIRLRILETVLNFIGFDIVGSHRIRFLYEFQETYF